MKETIGVITIGQAPRLDFTADLRTILSDQADVIEQGVLDGLSMDEIHALSPSPGNGETLLVSRLYNGEQVMLSKQKILPRIELIIHQMNETPIKMIILACTGEFPAFPSRVPVLYPDLILTHTVKGLLHEARDVDVVMPKEEQAAASAKKWNRLGLNVHPMICSPYEYTTSNMLMAVKDNARTPSKLIVLDCMGYSTAMKNDIRHHTNKNILVSRNLVFRYAAELL